MSLIITPIHKGEVTRIACPVCEQKVKYVALEKDSHIEGLTFKCRGCGGFFSVSSSRPSQIKAN